MSVAQIQMQLVKARAALTTAIQRRNAAQATVAAAQAMYDRELIAPTSAPARRGVLMRAVSRLTSLKRALNTAKAALAQAEIVVSASQQTVTTLEQRIQALTVPVTVPVPVQQPVGRFAKALLVGINYVGTQYALGGCINDVLNVEKQLRTFFPGSSSSSSSSEYRVLTDATAMKPSKANIMASIDWLVSGLKSGENVMFHFSGHGGRVKDTNGDEVTGLDSCIYPCNDGRMEMITDDELRTALAERLPAGCKCFAVLDACHSGTGVDLRYKWETPKSGTLAYSEDAKYAKTNGDIIFLSGCMDTEYAADTVDSSERPAGALTWALLDVWRTYGRAIKTKYLLWDVRAFLKKNGYSQVPQLSTGRYTDLQGVFDLGA